MPRSRANPNTRRRLLEEGVAAFLDRGFHGTGIQEVVERVQVPKGSFYNYFPSKEEFGAEAIRFYSESLLERLDQAEADSPDPVSALRTFFESLMEDFQQANYTGGCLMANLGGELEKSDPCRQALAEAFHALRDRFETMLRQAQKEGLVRTDLEATQLADLLIDSWEGAVIRMKVERSLEPLRRCLAWLLDGCFRP